MMEELKTLLLKIIEIRPEQFHGLGIVYYSNLKKLPISPLRKGNYLKEMPIINFDLVLQNLLEVSTKENIWHDGFHLISSEFHLTHFCQYFATPIIVDAAIEYNYGSRYRTALYGSYLDGVIACGVISSDFNAAIFRYGEKILL